MTKETSLHDTGDPSVEASDPVVLRKFILFQSVQGNTFSQDGKTNLRPETSIQELERLLEQEKYGYYPSGFNNIKLQDNYKTSTNIDYDDDTDARYENIETPKHAAVDLLKRLIENDKMYTLTYEVTDKYGEQNNNNLMSLEDFNSHFLHAMSLGVGFLIDRKRSKRNADSVNNDTISENHDKINETIVNNDKNNTIVTEKCENKTDNTKMAAVSGIKNGRRSMSDKNSSIQDTLLKFLVEMFDNIERKINPLSDLKIKLSENDNYLLGYIIATIDILFVSLQKLKQDVNSRLDWDDSDLIELFDRVKEIDKVVSTLLDSISSYLPSTHFINKN